MLRLILVLWVLYFVVLKKSRQILVSQILFEGVIFNLKSFWTPGIKTSRQIFIIGSIGRNANSLIGQLFEIINANEIFCVLHFTNFLGLVQLFCMPFVKALLAKYFVFLALQALNESKGKQISF